MKYFGLLIIIAFTCQNCFCQPSWYHYNWNLQTKDNFEINYKKAFELGMNRYKDNIYIGGNYKNFVRICALSAYDDLASGNIFTKLTEYENYLRKILCTIVKDTALTNKVKINIYNSSEFNASMGASGHLDINIGMMAQLDNEAELALVLGHEIAHYLNDDQLKQYGKWLELKYNERPSTGIAVLTAILDINNYYSVLKDYYFFSRDEEALADKISSAYLAESPYSLYSASGAFRKMKRSEIRGQIRYGKRSRHFSSHPDPGDRLTKIKTYSNDSADRLKHSFYVDSAMFMKLKTLCSMEVINENFLFQDLDAVISQSFANYLLYPDEKNNISVLIEAIRRKIALDEPLGIKDKSFILAEYQNKRNKGSTNYKFLTEKTPSILNYLDKGFINIWKEDLKYIKALELLDTTTTEFTTYAEAYEYFKTKANVGNNQIAQHYRFFETTVDSTSIENYIQQNSLFETNTYLRSIYQGFKNKGDVFVIVPPDMSDLGELKSQPGLELCKQACNLLHQNVASRMGRETYLINELDPGEQHRLRVLMAISEKKQVQTPGVTVKRNWFSICPELYDLFSKRGVKNVYVLRIVITKETKGLCCMYKLSLKDDNTLSFASRKQPIDIVWEDNEFAHYNYISKEMNRFYTDYSH